MKLATHLKFMSAPASLGRNVFNLNLMKHTMKCNTLLATVFLLSACAQIVWSKSGATEADLEKDTSQCQRDVEAKYPAINQPNLSTKAALALSKTVEDDVKSCLIGKGWTASTSK